MASSDIVNEIQNAFMREGDIEMVRQTLPGLIKVAEGMHTYYPKSPYYSGKLCFLWSAYTFAYIDESPYSDYDEAVEVKEKKLLDHYERAYRFGLISLNRRLAGFEEDILTQPEQALAKIKKRDIETLFWFNFAWAMLIFNNTADPRLVVKLATIKKVADAIASVQADYLNYAVYAIYVAYYGGRSETIGGDIEKSQFYYQKGLDLAKGESPILHFVFLKYVATQRENDNEFNRIYQKIMKLDPSLYAENAFILEMIKEKAKKLYLRKEELF